MSDLDPRITRAVDAFSSRRADIAARVERAVLADMSRFDGWTSPALVDELVAAVVAKVSAAQMTTAAVTDAYLARVTSYVIGRTTVGTLVPLAMGRSLRTGVDHEKVYGRVASEYRWQRSQGADDSRALSLAMVRARELVSADLGLAHTHQIRNFNQARGIDRYRRVIRPEASKSGTCGLCAAASDRIYHQADLLPVHHRCKCAVIAVTANTDPGSQLNDDTLSSLYAAADSTSGPSLKRVRVTVVEHGELGPQLRVKGQHFRDASDVAA